MNLDLKIYRSNKYSNKSQIARVLTEDWVKNNSYCPICGCDSLNEYANNKPVADFYCNACSEQFELKSKNAKSVGGKIVDGAYSTMISRIDSEQNPNFFFLTYSNTHWNVSNFLIIPKHYFIPDIIEKRNPLSSKARRAGWIGCNIDLTKIPNNGRIYLIKNSQEIPKHVVQAKWKGSEFLKGKRKASKGWILDIMNCVDTINNDIFSLEDVYRFESYLKEKYPDNNFIKDKIRQQLQLLRDAGVIEFRGKGNYRRVKYGDF